MCDLSVRVGDCARSTFLVKDSGLDKCARWTVRVGQRLVKVSVRVDCESQLCEFDQCARSSISVRVDCAGSVCESSVLISVRGQLCEVKCAGSSVRVQYIR